MIRPNLITKVFSGTNNGGGIEGDSSSISIYESPMSSIYETPVSSPTYAICSKVIFSLLQRSLINSSLFSIPWKS